MDKNQEEKKEAKIVEVPTQMGLAIQLEDGTVVDTNEALVRIYNKVLRIEKAVAE